MPAKEVTREGIGRGNPDARIFTLELSAEGMLGHSKTQFD
jgi:hypothetical protein